jgi:hypothetical protein
MPTSPTNANAVQQNETSPLLNSTNPTAQSPTLWVNGTGGIVHDKEPHTRAKKIVWTLLIVLFLAALVFFLGFVHLLSDKVAPWIGLMPRDPHEAALVIMKHAPVIVRALLLVGLGLY